MSNIGGDSSIRNNWNGKFKGMTDSEIKSFRRLDDKLSKNDVEISLEKYENELKQIKEVYSLRTNKSNFIVFVHTIRVSYTSSFSNYNGLNIVSI